MPPKKKVDNDGVRLSEGDAESTRKLSVEDYTLPKTMVLRLSKGMLPANTQIQKDALTALLRSATVFVNYLANSANDRAILANKKTIRPDDVIGALDELEFNMFTDRVNDELNKYMEIQNNKRNDYRRRIKKDQKVSTGVEGEDGELHEGMGDGEEGNEDIDDTFTPTRTTIKLNDFGARLRDSPPAAKKARTSFVGPNGERLDDDGDETIDEDEIEDDTNELEGADDVDDEEMEEEEEEAGDEDEPDVLDDIEPDDDIPPRLEDDEDEEGSEDDMH